MRSPTRWHAEAAGAKRAVRSGNVIVTKGPMMCSFFYTAALSDSGFRRNCILLTPLLTPGSVSSVRCSESDCN